MTSALLEVSGLCASYGAGDVIRNFNLEIREGQTTSLLGRTGAGKTSTLRAILGAGIERRGKVLIRGKDVSGQKLEKIAARGVMWVPDTRRIFSRLTVEQNLRLASAALSRRQSAMPVAEICRVFPMLEPLLGRHGDELSGGQQQIVAIARALAARPSVLLLDEPTEGLAPVIVNELVDVIGRLPREFGVAILLVEQNVSVAERLAADAVVLRLGETAYSGSLAKFSKDSALQDSLLGLGAVNQNGSQSQVATKE
jgi:ABC-type branched-subunit amino acid transport system ATPase component